MSGTYFPVHRGGAVTLYQDVHVSEKGRLPVVQMDGRRMFRNEQCRQDMCSAILEAKRMIYITWWSVYYKTKLVRDTTTRLVPGGSKLTLEDSLKRTANEGVLVVMMVWDDPTSVNKFHIRTEGIMKTRDEETQKFFKNSSVTCVLVSRSAPLEIFRMEKGVEFSMVYMEDILGKCSLPRKSWASVGFTVVPGFKVGKIVIQSQVYLVDSKHTDK